MELKAGVRILGLKPETLLGMRIVESVYEEFKKSLTITSVIEGKHSRGSLHYAGYAFDCRLPAGMTDYTNFVTGLKNALGSDFDVVLEKDHIHVEFQPKEAL